ncbi:MAG: FtsQ-type POTRA domain-containing protein [Candidatus Solibacter sp.]|jgi:cell division protein FtsQ
MAREAKKQPGRVNWRLTFAILACGAIGVSTAVAGYRASLFVTSDPRFALSHDRKDALTILGLTYASRSRVQRIFAGDFDRSIFSVPLAERRRRLLAIDWVEDASVSRVWPDRLVIRIRERTPVAFVSLRSGSLLIDAQGVLLEQPALGQFSFPVLSGVREEESEAERRARVRVFLQLQEDMGYLAKEISEVDASDADNIRIVVQVERRVVTLLLGDGNYAQRFQNFLNHYPEIRKGSPHARVFDLRLDGRITVKE